MERYIGTKVIEAEYGLAPREMGKHPAGTQGYRVRYPDGYESWSPKDVFEDAYRLLGETFDFGNALIGMKNGYRLARKGWNGKGMFVYYVRPGQYQATSIAAKSYFGEGNLVPYNGYFAIKQVNGTVSPWVPSVGDCLAEDWEISDD